MTQTTVYEMGVPASCTDGFCGNVSQFVVDAATLVVTHLIVEPERRSDPGKLVPISLLEAADDSVEIECDLAAFDALAVAEENSRTRPTSLPATLPCTEINPSTAPTERSARSGPSGSTPPAAG